MIQKKYLVLDPSEDPTEVLNQIKILDECDAQMVAFDVETDGLVEKTCRMIGFSITWEDNQGVYVILRKFNTETQTLDPVLAPEDEQDLMELVSDVLLAKNLVMHNGEFDCNVVYHSYGIDLAKQLQADTILMKHTLAEERPFGLKDIANLYKEHIGFTEEEAANQEQLLLKESVIARGGKWTKKQKDIYKGDPRIIGEYGCADTDLTLKLFWYLHHRLEEEELEKFFYDDEVMPLYLKCTIPMRRFGLFVDVPYFKKLEQELESDTLRVTGEIFSVVESETTEYVAKILDEKIKETRTGRFAEKVLEHYNIPIPSNKKTGKPTLARSALLPLLTAYPDHPALKWLTYVPPFSTETVQVEVVAEDGTSSLKDKKKKVLGELPSDAPILPKDIIFAVKKAMFVEDKPHLPYVFNLSSGQDMSWLLFQHYGVEPKSHSRTTGKPSVDKDSLESYQELPFIKNLLRMRKNQKLMNTYVKPILNLNIDGWVYPPMKQFGTISGRYSCGSDTEAQDSVADEINLQTLPRFERPTKCPNDKCTDKKKAKIWNSSLAYLTIDCPDCGHHEVMMDLAMIKRGFIAPPGWKIVNADFSALEPRIFSWVSGDPRLIDVWNKGLDLYSQVSIDVFGLDGVSADEKDENYLKKMKPEFRQKAKIFVLAVPYGAEAYRISQEMGCEYDEAQEIINAYLSSYPELKQYMTRCEVQAQNHGIVKSAFGRIRHIPDAKDLWQRYGKTLRRKKWMKELLGEEEGSKIYAKFRNLLNNSKNWPIQTTAGHVCNAAAIDFAMRLEEAGVEGHLALQVHDELTALVREKYADQTSQMLKESMENNWVTREITVPILAQPIIAMNLADAK